MKTGSLILILFLVIAQTSSRVLFFGETHSGKTTLINSACGLNLPVAVPGQMVSTTKAVTQYQCFDNQCVDTIGIFDYDKERKNRFSVAEILTFILENALNEGLSGIVWVWNTKIQVGNHELEEIFDTLQSLLPEIIPMVIVENQYQNEISNVPTHLSKTYNLPLLKVSPNNIGPLQDWIKANKMNYRFKLPSDWKNYLVKHDYESLKAQLLETSLLACDTVKEQLATLTRKINNMEQPKENCQCAMDCRRSKRYCCSRILGICVSRCTEEWIDDKCQREMTSCYETCKSAYGKMVADTNQVLDSLTQEFEKISSQSTDLLMACDKYHLNKNVDL